MSRGKTLGLLAQAPGFVDEARFEGDGLLHSAALLGHGLLLPISSADAVTAIWMFGSSGPLIPFAVCRSGNADTILALIPRLISDGRWMSADGQKLPLHVMPRLVCYGPYPGWPPIRSIEGK
jgi:hypothetical protein